MNRFHSEMPVFLLLILVVGMSCWRGFSGGGLSTAPVDNSLPQALIEVRGPRVTPGSYAFFSNPLTILELCARFYDRSSCGGRIPAQDRNRLLVSGDSVSFKKGGIRIEKMPGSRRLTLGIPLDPNRDGADDLMAVPGIGPVTANKIVDHVAANGPFSSMEQLQDFLGARISAPEYFKVDNNIVP